MDFPYGQEKINKLFMHERKIMERLTERKRNNDGSGISTKSLVFENGMQKGFPSGHCGRIVTKLAEYEDLE